MRSFLRKVNRSSCRGWGGEPQYWGWKPQPRCGAPPHWGSPPQPRSVASPRIAASSCSVGFLLLGLLSLLLPSSLLASGENPQQDAIPEAPMIRELFVPFDALSPILQGAGRRAFLTRSEYDALLEQSRRQAVESSPFPVSLISAEYDATVQDEVVRIRGHLILDVDAEGLQTIGLPLDRVAVRNASIDGRPAALAAPTGQRGDVLARSLLFIEGVGRHDLVLEMMLPVQVSAAQQKLEYQLPYASSGQIHLTVPGDVEIKTGPTVLGRTVDHAAGVTRFDLALRRDTTSLVMSLNNRQRQQEKVVVARCVLVDEFTEAYERLHITASMKVLHGEATRFRFALPSDMEVTRVTTARLSRWQVVREADRKILDVTLRTPESVKAIIHISAERTTPPMTDWEIPGFQPIDVAGSVSVIGLLVQQRLELQSLQSKNLIPIDVETLTDTLPDSLFDSEPGAPPIRPVAAYYAPGIDFQLTADFSKPVGQVEVVGNLLLTVSASGLEAEGGFSLLPLAEGLFDCNFSVESPWNVNQVTDKDGQSLRFERYENQDGSTRIHVILPHRVPAGQPYSLHFRARATPPEWLSDWASREVSIPQFTILEATSDRGAVAVKAGDDLAIEVISVEALVPLDENNKAEFQLDQFDTDLAFRYDARPFAAALKVQRVTPRITCETYSFLTIQPGKLQAHYELAFEAQDAHARSVSFQLPKSTPPEVTIRGIDGVNVKQTTPQLVADARVWTVHLAKPAIGTIRLAVDFQQPLDTKVADRSAGRVSEVTSPLLTGRMPIPRKVADRSAGRISEATSPLLTGRMPIPRKVADHSAGRNKNTAGSNDEGSDGNSSIENNATPSLIPTALTLPLVEARGVVYQTGSVSVEGDPELEIRLESTSRRLDVGELVEAEYQPGRRLLGVFGFVGKPIEVIAYIRRPEPCGLPSAIVQRAELVTATAASGVSQTTARYLLQSKASFIEVQLPPASTLWSAVLDGTPAKPQRDGDRILISLPNRADVRDLQLVYETPTRKLGLWGEVHLGTPQLALRSGADTPRVSLPVANLVWHVALPPGYRLAANRGSVFPDLTDPATRDLLAARPSWRRRWRAATSKMANVILAPLAPASAVSDQRGLAQVYESRPEPSDEANPFGDDPFGGESGKSVRSDADTGQTSVEKEEDRSGEMAWKRMSLTRAGKPTGSQSSSGQWALQGLRSLNIDLATNRPKVAFQSLGSEPVLDVTIVDYQRLKFLSWALGLLVLAAGISRLRQSFWKQLRLVACVLIVATLLPLLFGWQREWGHVLDAVFGVGLGLIPIYIAWDILRWIGRFLPTARGRTAAATAAVVACLLLPQGARAAQGEETEAELGPITVKIVPPQDPIHVPDDVVIIPYDASTIDGESIQGGAPEKVGSEKVIVPYDTYLKLLKIAELDEHPQTAKPARPFAWAGTTWTATLEDGDWLRIRGQMRLNLFSDEIVKVPLTLGSGTLESATIDGDAARIKFIQPDALPPVQQMQQKAAPAQQLQPALLALYVKGKGEKQLELTVRYRLTRRGGWRVCSGNLPRTATSTVQLRVPNANTELQLSGVVAKPLLVTDRDNQAIDTTMLGTGSFLFQWRPKIAQLAVDGSLTAKSEAVFDIQEDSLRLVWQLELQFPRSQRDVLQLQIPKDYVVEKVEGDNIRQWRRSENVLDITLLETARNAERVTLHLSRIGAIGHLGVRQGSGERGRAGQAAIDSFDLPWVAVEEASLHEGKVAIRRSPQLEIRSSGNEGLTRIDLESIQAVEAITNESPLGIQPFQAYHFGRTPFRLKLEAAPVATRVTASVQTLLRVSEMERTLESRVAVQVGGSPLYQVALDVPADLVVRDLQAPGEFQWSLVSGDSDKTKRLTLFFANGQSNKFSIVLHGILGRRVHALTADLPTLTVDGADRQQTAIVVQTDPSFDVRPMQLQGCQTELLQRTFGWLATSQRRLARLAIHAAGPTFSGKIQLVKRTPKVHCQTVSNLRVTPRAFEDTILLDFDIQDAGIREIVFLLPSDLRDARVRAKLLRKKTIQDVGDDQIRVRLELQDEVMGQFRVLVENDRLITGARRSVPIPVVETGVTRRRFVSLESAGRDEIIVAEKNALEPLERQQRQWRDLAALIGGDVTQAYLVEPTATAPRLVVQTQDREAVETVGATIPLSQTRLTVDQHGTYRGEQVYQVDNRTEQFLEIVLPEGSRLWTAQVAGEGVKPITGKGTIRIPLVKTAAGDQDYPVILKYGGTIADFESWQSVGFPLIKTKNIKVEESQVRLFLPQPLRWFNFAGTMRRVDEEELFAGYLRYQTNQIKSFCAELSNANPFARVRSLGNLRKLASEAEGLEHATEDWARSSQNKTLQKELFKNKKALEAAQQAIKKDSSTLQESDIRDNRDKLGLSFEQQRNGISQNIVNSQQYNFSLSTDDSKKRVSKDQQVQQGRSLRRDWFYSNDLLNSQGEAKGQSVRQRDSRIIQKNKTKELDAFRSRKAAGWGKKLPRKPNAPPVEDEQSDRKDMQQTAPQRGKQSRVQQFRERLQQTEQPVTQPQVDSGLQGYFGNAGRRSNRRLESTASGEVVFGNERNRPAQSIPATPQLAPSNMFEPAAGPARGGGQYGMGMEGGGFGGRGNQSPSRAVGLDPDITVTPDLVLPGAGPIKTSPAATGLASLDVALPVQGVEYLFMTPRGDIEITARYAERAFVGRMIRLVLILTVLLLASIISYRVQRRSGSSSGVAKAN